MKTIVIETMLELLEDFHIGSGAGTIGLFDDGQIKDEHGIPQINPSTFKGLLKDSCEDLVQIQYKDWDDTLFKQVFIQHDYLNSLDIIVSTDTARIDADKTLIHYFTKISSETGTAETGTLRSIECGAKGMIFKIIVIYSAPGTHADTIRSFLTDGLKNIKSIGGHRRRGFGAVKTTILRSSVVEIDPGSLKTPESDKLLVKIKLEADTLFSAKAQMGNLLQTNDYIPGTTILGMFRSIKVSHRFAGSYLDDGNCSVSCFYPLPSDDKGIDLKILPAPLSLRKRKTVINQPKGMCSVPVWGIRSQAQGRFGEVLSSMIVSNSMQDEEQDIKESTKGMYDGYICTEIDDKLWAKAEYYKASIILQQRNAIDRASQSTKLGGVFIEQKVQKDTIFQGTISFKQIADAKQFIQDLNPWLSGNAKVHLGKGAMPAVISCTKAAQELSVPVELKGTSFTITMLSDCILMDEQLFPQGDLSVKTLSDLLGDGFADTDFLLLQKASRNGIASSFSGLSGLRRFRDLTIRKGSCYRFRYLGNNPALLIQRLVSLQNVGIGFRKFEGFGSISINHPIHGIKLQKIENINDSMLATALVSSDFSNGLTARALCHKNANDFEKKLRKTIGQNDKYWSSMLSGVLFKLEGNTPALSIKEALNAKKTEDGWKTSDCRYKMAELILPLLDDPANTSYLVMAMKRVLNKEPK